MPLTRQTMVNAGDIAVTGLEMYANENRDRVKESILAEDPELQRRYLAGLSKDPAATIDQDDFEAAAEELYQRGNVVLRSEYEELHESEKQRLHENAIEQKKNIMRGCRQNGTLVENEESLKQKEEDEKNGITPDGQGAAAAH